MSSIACAGNRTGGSNARTAILREIRFHPLAEEDLDRIDDFVATRSPSGARGLAERLEGVIEQLSRFPDSGRPRDDLAVGIRTITVDHTLLVAYKVDPNHILILRIFYAGRDFEADLRDDEQDQSDRES